MLRSLKKKKRFFLTPNYISAFLLLFDVKFISNLPLKMEVALSLTRCCWPFSNIILFIYITPALCILSLRHSTAPALLLWRQISGWLTCELPFYRLPFLGQSLLFSWMFFQYSSCINFLWDSPVTCLPSLIPRTALPDGYYYPHFINKGTWESVLVQNLLQSHIL